MHGDLCNGVLFNLRYQTQECNEHQPVPSGLVIYPGYQQCQQFHLNVCTSNDESPCSESPSGSSGSGSENVNKQWEATEVKILISAYKDQENLNNSKSSKGKKSVWEKIFDTSTEHCKMAGLGSLRDVCFTFLCDCWNHHILKPKCDAPQKIYRGK